jgi:hypothetical protein
LLWQSLWQNRQRNHAPQLKTAPRLSIVVLPFENLSGDRSAD